MLPGTIENFVNNACITTVDYKGYGNFTPYSNGSFSAYDDPVGPFDYAYTGFDRAEDIVNTMNEMFNNNKDAFRKSNDTLCQNPPLSNVSYPNPPPPIKIQFVLAGVYFHETPTAEYRSSFHTWQSSYAVNPSSEINIYYHSSYTEKGDGQANNIGGASKYNTQGEYYYYMTPDCREWSLSFAASATLHEIGHNLSLHHTFNKSTDYCDDTPPMNTYDKYKDGICYPNTYMGCWSYIDSTTAPLPPICPGSTNYPCDEWHEISNNFMDYNQYKESMTTCQIGRMHTDLANDGNNYIYACGGCAPPSAFFHLNDEYSCPSLSYGNTIATGIPFKGQASFNENRWYLEICEVASLSSTTCIPGTYFHSGTQTGQVGNFDLTDVYTFPTTSSTKYYYIKLTTSNTECPQNHSYDKTIKVTGCLTNPDLSKIIELRVVNPVSSQLTAFYTLHQAGDVQIRLINIYTSQSTTIETTNSKVAGDYFINFPVSSLPSGSYSLQVMYNNSIISKNLIML
ncbi:MAG: hypothetical protein J5I59_09800 [Saprospiraceae bacterium]|nr:hypothetical protein [Saprospiraceae bacterium]